MQLQLPPHAVVDLEADDRDRHLDAALGAPRSRGLAGIGRRAVVAAVGDEHDAAAALRGPEVVRHREQRRCRSASGPCPSSALTVSRSASLSSGPDRHRQLRVPAALCARDLADLGAVDAQPERRALGQPVDERVDRLLGGIEPAAAVARVVVHRLRRVEHDQGAVARVRASAPGRPGERARAATRRRGRGDRSTAPQDYRLPRDVTDESRTTCHRSPARGPVPPGR